MHKISVLMPAYNEEKYLFRSVTTTAKELAGLPYEIIIINDGSSDNTEEVAFELSRKYKNIKVISYKKNHGKGYALREGFKKSEGDLIVFLDADLDIHPNQIHRFIRAIKKGYDIVIGSKYLPGARVNYTFKRWLFSILYRKLVKVLLSLDVSDTQVGLKVFRREVLENVFPRITVKRYAFDVELLTVASMSGYRIKEIPIKIEHKNHNSSIDISAILKMFIDTMAIYYRKNILQYYSGGTHEDIMAQLEGYRAPRSGRR